jgi:hypothetical protein
MAKAEPTRGVPLFAEECTIGCVSHQPKDTSPMWVIGVAGLVIGVIVTLAGFVLAFFNGAVTIVVGLVIVAAGLGALALDRAEQRSRL